MAGHDLKKNKMWVNRMSLYFDTADQNKNGFLEIEDILQWATNLEADCKATESEMTTLREEMRKFWGALGLTPGKKMTKEEFIQGLNLLAKEELERERRQEQTYFRKLSDAFFDVVDINNDGTVKMDELKVVMKATNTYVAKAESLFKAADVNKNGVIERDELFRIYFDFWFHPEKEENSNLFGEEYSGRQSLI